MGNSICPVCGRVEFIMKLVNFYFAIKQLINILGDFSSYLCDESACFRSQDEGNMKSGLK